MNQSKQYHALSLPEQIELQEQRDELLLALEEIERQRGAPAFELCNIARDAIAKAKASKK